MEYESRISVNEVGHVSNSLEKIALFANDFFQSLPMGDEDGSIFNGSITFDIQENELVCEGRGGPATRVAKYVSSENPNLVIRLAWLTDEGNRGVRFYKFGQQL